MSDFLEKLASIDALNSWVRSKSFGRAINTPRRRIYEAKRDALKDAIRLLDCEHKLLTVMARCRDCGGSGRYDDGYRKFDHCWRCFSKGMVRLEFVESSIGGRFRWHTPRSMAYGIVPATLSEASWAASEWDVNQKGRDLTPDEAAKHLLIIDDAWPVHRYGDCDKYCECTGHYKLWVGEVVDHCAHCGEQGELMRCHKSAGRVEFTFAACRRCHNDLSTEKLWDVPLPWDLIQPENIMAWVNANSALLHQMPEVRA